MPEQTDTQRDLQLLAADLKRLEAEYNMFFAGRLPRPPWETRGRVEALQAQRFDVDERRATQDQVAEDLADGGALEESVSGEPGRVEEARDARRLPDDRGVVWRHLVEPGPPAADTGVGDPRRPPPDHLHQAGDPVVGCLDAEARLLMRVGHPHQ